MMSRLWILFSRAGRTRKPRRGFTLIEAAVSAVIIAVMFSAALSTAAAARAREQKAIDRQRGLDLAQSLMSEILDKAYVDPGLLPLFGPELAELLQPRSVYNDVDDYNGLVDSPPTYVNGTAITGYSRWSRTVTVQWVHRHGLYHRLAPRPNSTSKKITVTVTKNSVKPAGPQRFSFPRRGTRYEPSPPPKSPPSRRHLHRRPGNFHHRRRHRPGQHGRVAPPGSRSKNASADAAEARLYAEAGLDTAADYLSKNPTTWRTAKPQGVWSANVPFAHGSFTIAGADPIDANFANRPYDPLVLTCTGTKGTATHIASVTLKAQGTPIAALAMAVHTAGQFRVNSGTLTATGAPISTNGTLRADGTVTGSAQCTLSIGSGTVTGGITLLAPNKPMPPAGIKAMYQALATTISPGSSIDRKILAPGLNNTVAGGPTNADGVYYISTTNDTTISNCRINGTLIVDCPGKTVTISGAMFMAPARTDYPVLIVNGKLVLQTSGGTLSEATLTTNFNPTGAPYQGTTDSDTQPRHLPRRDPRPGPLHRPAPDPLLHDHPRLRHLRVHRRHTGRLHRQLAHHHLRPEPLRHPPDGALPQASS